MFGNVNDKKSEISKNRAEHDNRIFYSLEMLHTLPNVNYLAKVRNSDEIVHLKEEETQETIGGHQGKKEETQEGVH